MRRWVVGDLEAAAGWCAAAHGGERATSGFNMGSPPRTSDYKTKLTMAIFVSSLFFPKM